ncbi:MAG TPA: hypothetical protein VLL82_14120 [Mycobacterium sp.]|nr:hypothetical protein [Mycobacterium sp.]
MGIDDEREYDHDAPIMDPDAHDRRFGRPPPAFLARLLETDIADRDGDPLVFTSARRGGYLTLGQARYTLAKAAAAVGASEVARDASINPFNSLF